MKKLLMVVVLVLAPALQATQHGTREDSVLSWHTYAGSSMDEDGSGVAVDPSGNVYLTGWSDATWGSPIVPHSGGRDNFVAKLNSTGELDWNTFLGPSGEIQANAIALDGSGNVFVVGTMLGTTPPVDSDWWGHFVAKLNSNGELQWLRLGATTYWGVAETVAVDAIGNIYVGGWGACWLAPGVFLGSGGWVAKLDSSGADVWHANLACFHGEEGALAGTLAVDASGNVYVTGRSNVSWGSPIVPYSEGDDALVAKLNSDGILQWNTFMGAPGFDSGSGIALDRRGNVYVSGSSEATWGTPVNSPAGPGGALAAKLDSSGVRQWHTFLPWGELGFAVAKGRNIYVTGVGGPHCGFVAALNRRGVLQWSTFLHACLNEMTLGRSHVYVVGQTTTPWGTPVNPHAGGWDVYVAKIAITRVKPHWK
jgi:hypothetical protein